MTAKGLNGKRLELKGISLSHGIAFGKTYRFRQIDLNTLKDSRFEVENVEDEFNRLISSVEKSKDQLNSIYKDNIAKARLNVADIFNAQLMLLNDEAFLNSIRDTVKTERSNIEHILYKKIVDIEENFRTIDNEVIRTKLSDIQDVYHRLLRNLLDIEHVRVTPLLRAVKFPILIAEHLLPSDMALLELRKIKGIIIEEGSTVSHVAIIAKSLGIPVLTNIPGITSLVAPDSMVAINGFTGTLIINPSDAEVENLRAQRRHQGFKNGKREFTPCITKDGVRIRVDANANAPVEIEEALQNGAEGIGLLRTEIFYLSKSKLPIDREEDAFYKRIHFLLRGRPLTIRLLDLGADKTLPYLHMPIEDNPQLGVRGIRYLLRERDLFERHLTNILRSSNYGQIKVMIPFVSIVSEVEQVLELINHICKKEHLDRSNIKVGIMVEVPSILWLLPAFIDSIDFMSIGTNDLTQYTAAAAREDGSLDEYREGVLGTIMLIIQYVASMGLMHNKEVSVCGELASDPRYASIMVGLGIRSLSVRPTALLAVRTEIEGQSAEQMSSHAKLFLSIKDDELPLRA